jgi:hypothetical protein
MSTRRELLKRISLGVSGAALTRPEIALAAAASEELTASPTGSDVGTLYPFIRSQAAQGQPSLSFLRDEFPDAASWQPRARGKLLELLHYAPPPCDPRPEVVESVDRGDYVREKVYFNTTPDIRVPAYVLVPKQRRPAPALVALHDHGGFYFWGKEKLVDLDDEHPVLTRFKQEYYAGNSIAADLARQG